MVESDRAKGGAPKKVSRGDIDGRNWVFWWWLLVVFPLGADSKLGLGSNS